jgi:hypothetical protein
VAPRSQGEFVEQLSEAEEGTTRKPKKQARKPWWQKRELKFFVENVTVRYILAIQDLPKKQQKSLYYTTSASLVGSY